MSTENRQAGLRAHAGNGVLQGSFCVLRALCYHTEQGSFAYYRALLRMYWVYFSCLEAGLTHAPVRTSGMVVAQASFAFQQVCFQTRRPL